jgi:hypothetical protein
MNRQLATALVIAAAAAAGNAFAYDITIDTTPFVSSKSRAEVQTELTEFKKAGTSPWSTQFNQLGAYRGQRSCAKVTSEYVALRNAVAALTGEDSGSANLACGTSWDVGTTLAGQPQRNAR